jgi:hypothetical protein
MRILSKLSEGWNKLLAKIYGVRWLHCPLCGAGFGAHQIRNPQDRIYLNSKESAWVCHLPSCIAKAIDQRNAYRVIATKAIWSGYPAIGKDGELVRPPDVHDYAEVVLKKFSDKWDRWRSIYLG